MPAFLIEYRDASGAAFMKEVDAHSREDAWARAGFWLEASDPGRTQVVSIYAKPAKPIPNYVRDTPVFIINTGTVIIDDPAEGRKLDSILNALAALTANQESIMATVQEALDAVTAAKGKVDSLETLVKQLHDIIVAMPTGGLTPEQQAAIDQIKTLSDTEATEVQAAIDANQPPTPPTP